MTDYCQAGGKLAMGARTGYKDEYGRCIMQPMPGPAADLCGVTVEEYSLPQPAENVMVSLEGNQYPVTGFQEQLCASGSKVLACYDSGWMKGSAALCEKECSHGGRAWYSGTGFSEPLAIILLEKAGVASPYESIIQCPPDVELAVRSGKNADWYFLLNYTETAQPIKVSSSLTPVIGETDILQPFDVAVWKQTKKHSTSS